MSLADAPLTASVPAKDKDRAKAWYEEKLGLTPTMDLGPAGLLYKTGGYQWIIYPTEFAGTGKHTLGAFIVADLDATVRELSAKGVKFEDYDMGDSGPTTVNGVARAPDGSASAWIVDSEGNTLAITQLPPGMSM
jgi:predicted enzyme related to lactoylglutathione lyase